MALALPLAFADAGWAAGLHGDGLERLSLTVGNRLERLDAPSGLRSKQNGETDDRQAEANRLLSLGIEQYNRSEWRTALATWQEALGIYQAIGNRSGEAQTLNNIGVVHDYGDSPIMPISLPGTPLRFNLQLSRYPHLGPHCCSALNYADILTWDPISVLVTSMRV